MAFASTPIPQQLRDRIIGFLHDDIEDLKACALSTRSMVNVAQSHLFYDISVTHPRNSSDNPLSEEENQAFLCAAYGRLANILTERQDLRKVIQSISFVAYPGVATLLAGMDLPELFQMQIYPDTSGVLDGPVVEPLRLLISLESMRHVRICASFSARIFSTRTPHLKHLAFECAAENTGLPAATLPPDTQRTVVTKLCLHDSACTTHWLMDVQCPFDFTHLVELALHMSMCDGVLALLDVARHTLSILTITLDDLLGPDIDLAAFRALKEIYVIVADVCCVVAFLPSIWAVDRANLIRRITFRAQEFCANEPPHMEGHLAHFDAMLATRPLPALQEVEIILPEPDELDVYDEIAAAVKEAMPLLEERGALRVLMADN